MKKRKKRAIALALCAAVAAGITGVAFWLFGNAEPQSLTVSAGVQYLADRTYVAASAPAGERITFSAEWFDEAVRGAPVASITVTSLPDATKGELMLGYGEVSVGQTIRRENLSYLSFQPCAGVESAEFSFLPETEQGAGGYDLVCHLSFTDGENCCPSTKGSVSAVSTHATLSLAGTLVAEDPEGDALYFEVVSYPENGTLRVESESGAFFYTPNTGFAGNDSFVWRAQDEHGAFSEECRVSVKVRELTAGYLFADMEGHSAHSDALYLSERGLMSGQTLGQKQYFHPNHTLTRAAFVAILLEAAGVEVPPAERTGFTDDADIPKGMRAAVAYAKEQGWLGEDTVFRPNDPITRAEAADIAARVLGLSAPGYHETVEDHAAIPVSVVDALYAAFEGGYLSTMSDGTLSPSKALSRGEAASFFARVLTQREQSLFPW